MAENSKIEWTKSTFNPWIGCTKVSPGCDHCYAEVSTPSRTMNIIWGAGQPRHRTGISNWNLVRRWNAEAAKTGEFWPVFTASLADIFDNEVPDEWRADFWALVRDCPHLTFQILTKRIGNAPRMLPADWGTGYPNVWLISSIVNQPEADRDIDKLLAIPAAVHGLSMEPLLGPVNLYWHLWRRMSLDEMPAHVLDSGCGDGRALRKGIDWVIVGGESGHKARPMHPEWARSLRDQCAAAGVPFLFKQWGEWAPDWEGAETCAHCKSVKADVCRENNECAHCGGSEWIAADRPLDNMCRVGKKAAGRLLDGRLHDGYPEATA